MVNAKDMIVQAENVLVNGEFQLCVMCPVEMQSKVESIIDKANARRKVKIEKLEKEALSVYAKEFQEVLTKKLRLHSIDYETKTYTCVYFRWIELYDKQTRRKWWSV